MSHFYTQKSNLSNVIVIQDRIFLFVFIDAGTVWLLQGEDLCQSSIGYLNHIAPSFNPLPDDKILDWSKLKLIADNILKCF